MWGVQILDLEAPEKSLCSNCVSKAWIGSAVVALKMNPP